MMIKYFLLLYGLVLIEGYSGDIQRISCETRDIICSIIHFPEDSFLEYECPLFNIRARCSHDIEERCKKIICRRVDSVGEPPAPVYVRWWRYHLSPSNNNPPPQSDFKIENEENQSSTRLSFSIVVALCVAAGLLFLFVHLYFRRQLKQIKAKAHLATLSNMPNQAVANEYTQVPPPKPSRVGHLTFDPNADISQNTHVRVDWVDGRMVL